MDSKIKLDLDAKVSKLIEWEGCQDAYYLKLAMLHSIRDIELAQDALDFILEAEDEEDLRKRHGAYRIAVSRRHYSGLMMRIRDVYSFGASEISASISSRDSEHGISQ